ncbi:MAG TPA: styrene monooxygenase/indole monooxygenase family protein [Gammaproteobacteria bacterium]|nr:styrene monooxygenase/indole monooxygenase family protein [Gammaproteobacteria bacterium]
MERKIAIIGAGQSGLQLAIGLAKNNFSVSLFSNKTAEQILQGNILSSQCMFGSALAFEKALQLNFWDTLAPKNQAFTFSKIDAKTSERMIYWQGVTDQPHQSVDQRLKFSQWMNYFEEIGGNLYIQELGLDNINQIAAEHELTIIASGKGSISQLFSKDSSRCHFDEPQRVLCCLYMHKTKPAEGLPGVRANLIPGIGECFAFPGLTMTGPCEMVLFEGVPGGAFDCWKKTQSVTEKLEVAKKLLKKFIPWEYERYIHAEPTDEQASLTGEYTPIIRQPFFKLADGKYVLGMGDTLVLNDPIAGQGANNASKAAHVYMENIIKRGHLPFDNIWMHKTFEDYWERYGRWSTQWSTMLLLPPPPHVVSLLNAASQSQTVANLLANSFDNPATLFPWITDNNCTSSKIKSILELGLSS